MSADVQTKTIRTKIPARLDRLPWARFHWLVVLGLGTAWVLDGLEVTIVGTMSSRMTESGSGITISPGQIGLAGSIYVVGACLGALFFGQLTDRFGRKKLFVWTLGLYLVATAATAFAFSPWYFFAARFLTGAGIGGEYAAVNSAIDELIPARARGRVDLIINGSYWVGSAAGSAASIALLNTAWLPKDIGWRLGFALGVILAIAVLYVRRHVPESPRWLFIHGREDEAEAIVGNIEDDVQDDTGEQLRGVEQSLTVRQREVIPFREIARVAVKTYPKRSLLALALFVGQAFIYNGITFNLGTLMTTFFNVSSGFVPVFIILYAVANFLGPLTIGRLFDTVGRKPMIAGTYLGSAILGAILAWLFTGSVLNQWTFIAGVMATFFLASAGASAAYLTASEIFPMETRALAIAFFYAIGTAVGGISGPLLFGNLIGSGNAGRVAIAFWIGSVVMAIGGLAELAWGVKAEGQQLEDVAKPLTTEDAESGGGQQGGQAHGADGQAATQPGEAPEVRAARAAAERERARAAEHRARMHELSARAEAGDSEARDQGRDESVLAQMADLAARGHDERAAAARARAEAQQAGGADQPDGQAALEREGAARARARAFDMQAEALAPDHPADGERHALLADAARERARAREQRAEAALLSGQQTDAGDDARLAAARRRHEEWAALHDARARLLEARARGDDAAAGSAERDAEAQAERARAAGAEIDAAEHQARADSYHDQQEESQRAQRQRRERERERVAYEERVRARLERQRAGTRGLRRFRPGPGRLVGGSPAISAAAREPGEALDHEIGAIERVLQENGTTARSELRDMLGARYWGPGVFGRALAEAVRDGEVRRVGRDRYAPSDAEDD